MKNMYSYTPLCLLLLFVSITLNVLGQQHLQLSTYSGQSVIRASGSVILKPGFHITAGNTVRIYTDGAPVICTTPPGSSDQNYVRIDQVRQAGLTTEAAVDSARCDITKVSSTFMYYDGLGRKLQDVQYQASPEGKDIIQPYSYDNYNREDKKYLPYVSGAANGNYRPSAVTEQTAFYNSPPPGVVSIPTGSGHVGYSQMRYEASPLDRVLEQGFPGGDWKIGGGHTLRSGFGFNGTNDVRDWTVNSSGATGTTYYPKSRLYADTVIDENGNKSITYTDLDKRVVLKRNENGSGYLDTYYVYDLGSNLRYVIPPGYTGTSFTEADTGFDHYIYAYHHNDDRQVIEKKVPGKGWEYFVYDSGERLVMSQDANQRAKSPQDWTIIKYDMLGRQVLTGIYSHGGSTANTSYRSYHQGQVDGNSQFYETRTGTGTGYTNVTYPSSWSATLSINYYNNYTIPGKTSTYDASQTVTTRTQTLLTGSKVNILGTSDMLLSVNYYDERGRLIEVVSDNHLGGTDRVVNTWNFAGELTASTRTHQGSAGNVTIANRYEYDPMGRKTKTYQKIGGDAEVLLAELDYNELGQVRDKLLHSGLQTVSQTYNARGWMLTKSSPLFSMQLKYTDGTTPRYNGDITGMLWGTPGNLNRNYVYNYDKLNRLLSGISGTGNHEKDITYDDMGNILTLTRDSGTPQTYTYSGNRLSSVSGGASRSYTYDLNGNALTDGTNTFTYNLLNLPQTVAGSAAITYTYTSTGKKLRTVINGSARDYVDGIEMAGATIDFIHTEQGLARKSGGSYLYEYTLDDHLGNNRLNFDIYGGLPRVIQHDDYYPFGKTFNSYVSGARKNYLYNGKELQNGLAQYDYGARFYDPAVGRWSVIDPMAELGRRFSNYIYALNNPIRYIDPDGMWSTDIWGNDFTSDYGEISSIINGFKSQSHPENINKYVNSLSKSSSKGDDNPKKKKSKKKSSFIVFGDKFETAQTRKALNDGLLDENITQYYADRLGHHGEMALFSLLPSSFARWLGGAASKVSGKLDGSFSVSNWEGYPSGGVKPEGPFRLLEGQEYSNSRDLANSTNSAIRKADPESFRGLQIHEIHPIKFGGNPTNMSNKILLTPAEHAQYTNFWNSMMRGIK